MSETSKREQFRNYVEDSGVVDSMTRVIASMYDQFENGIDALTYLKQHFGRPEGYDANQLKAENEKLKGDIAELESRIAALKGSQK